MSWLKAIYFRLIGAPERALSNADVLLRLEEVYIRHKRCAAVSAGTIGGKIRLAEMSAQFERLKAEAKRRGLSLKPKTSKPNLPTAKLLTPSPTQRSPS